MSSNEWSGPVLTWVGFLSRLPASTHGVDADLVDVLRGRLSRADERRFDALWVLSGLPWPYTAALVDVVVDLAVSHGFAGECRQLLGRMPFRVALDALPAIVAARLDGADYDEVRRLAELLEHVGLRDALAELCRRASESDDPDVREVAKDFAQTWAGQ